MTHDDVLALMEAIRAATGCPYAYDHFAEGESPDPPFLCFLYPQAAEFGADNIVYHSLTHLDIEVYTDLKDPELEKKVEAVLSAYELFYPKAEVLIGEEKMYGVVYGLTV